MEGSHTDVVEDFSYSSRNRTYNSDYLIWRRHTKGAFIYRFTGIQNENVYVDGNAVAPVTAASAERNALMQCSQIIGLALLVFLLIAVVGGSVLIALLRLFHIDIRLDFLSLQMDGSQWACVAVKSITAVLKYLLPSMLLLRICKDLGHVRQVGQNAMDEIYISWQDSVHAAHERYGEILDLKQSGKLIKRQIMSDYLERIVNAPEDMMRETQELWNKSSRNFDNMMSNVEQFSNQVQSDMQQVFTEFYTNLHEIKEEIKEEIKRGFQ